MKREADMVVGWGWSGEREQSGITESRIRHHGLLCGFYDGINNWMKQA
jgi:hypothetical protein